MSGPDVPNPEISGIAEFLTLLLASFSGSRIRYEAGDHVAIFPSNATDLVQVVIDRMDVDPDKVRDPETFTPAATVF